jgi:hypothetical protein
MGARSATSPEHWQHLYNIGQFLKDMPLAKLFAFPGQWPRPNWLERPSSLPRLPAAACADRAVCGQSLVARTAREGAADHDRPFQLSPR